MSRGFIALVLSAVLFGVYTPAAVFASEPQLNFKIYSPESTGTGAEPSRNQDDDAKATTATDAKSTDEGALGDQALQPSTSNAEPTGKESEPVSAATPELKSESAVSAAPAPQPQDGEGKPSESTPSTANAAPAADKNSDGKSGEAGSQQLASKVLQGYVRVVPSGTKIPIIMDTAVDSDTSQEGDEFEARTAEDLTIDGQIAVPAGSIIKGRIAQLNAPRHLNRSGSVALKFDTVTTPDNRQIPLVANLVARGGVVHARRGMKDIAMDVGTFSLPTAAGVAIGAIAGGSSSGLGVAGGTLIGAGVGVAVGVAVLLAKKGKRVDVRAGDEMKIELAEDLHMPTM